MEEPQLGDVFVSRESDRFVVASISRNGRAFRLLLESVDNPMCLRSVVMMSPYCIDDPIYGVDFWVPEGWVPPLFDVPRLSG